jgi:hypothetical protein
MHLFIDTNVFVGFYEMSSDRLDELEKLITVVRKEQATLWLPDQVRREFWKNRESSVIKAIKDFEKGNVLPAVPLLVREDIDFAELLRKTRDLEALKDQITSRVREQIVQEKTRADTAIRTLFQSAQVIDTNPFFTAAHIRALRRQPPGKEEALGDRISWVALLGAVPQGTELHVISDDGDFESDVTKEEIKPYLLKEWQTKKSGNVRLWKRLSQFLASFFPDAKNAIDMERSIAAQSLLNSSSFNETHRAVAELAGFDRFSPEQAQTIMSALLNNSQVRWIASDSDVKNFAETFLKNNSAHLDEDSIRRVQELYS